MPQLKTLKLIAIDGPPGTGKSALARKLAAQLNARMVLDQMHDNPYLEKFLENQRSYALHTQICSLLSRYKQQAEIAQPDLFHQTTITDYTIIKDEIFAQLTLSPDEFRLYLHLSSVLIKNFLKPDLVLFLHARSEILKARLEQQDDSSNNKLERVFLADLADSYNTYFFQYDEAPLLTVEVNDVDLVRQEIDLQPLIEQMEQLESGHEHFVPHVTD